MESSIRSLLLILLLSSSLLVLVGPSPGKAQPLQIHDPILITSDSGFNDPLNGVRSGFGTLQSPFIIEDWEITANATAGIRIRNAQSFFIIRNVFIHPANFTRESSGIFLENVANGQVENSRIANFQNGISLSGSQNIITTNTVWNNTYGMVMTGSGNTISGNQLYNNTQYGMLVKSGSTANILTGNNASSNGNGRCERIVDPCDGEGFLIVASSNNVFDNNIAMGNDYYGFRTVLGSTNNIYKNNNVSKNQFGLVFSESSGSQVFTNTLTNNDFGIGLEFMNTDTNITMNHILSNTQNAIGIYVVNSSRNIIYNNFLQNPINAYDDQTKNAWNITKSLATNILGGPFQGGNYYADYTGSDPDGDGIGNTPYSIQGGSVGHLARDLLPLVQAQPTGPIHDVAVRSVNAQPASARTGAEVNITVEVFNQGTATESFAVSVAYNQTIINQPVNIANLPPLSSRNLNISWDTSGLNAGTYILKANASQVTGEFHTADNVSPPTTITLTLNKPPSAQVSISATSTSAGTTITLDGSASMDQDGTITSYSWDFGDGTTGTGPIVTHSYSTAGIFTVELRVRDNDGELSNPVSQTVTVSSNQPDPPGHFQLTATTGRATITWSPPSNTGGSPVTKYKIYRATSPSEFSWIANTTDTSYVDTTVSNGQLYYYKVTAVNGAGLESDKDKSPQQYVLIPRSGVASLPDNPLLWAALAVTIIAAVTLGVVVIRRRRITSAKTA